MGKSNNLRNFLIEILILLKNIKSIIYSSVQKTYIPKAKRSQNNNFSS